MGNKDTYSDGTSCQVYLLTNPTLPADKCVILKGNQEWATVDCNEPKFVVCKRGWKANYTHIYRFSGLNGIHV